MKSPDQINAEHGRVVYRCRVCRAESDLVWFNGTSCPVCRRPECAKELWREWDEILDALAELALDTPGILSTECPF